MESMIRVKLKVFSWLSQRIEGNLAGFDEEIVSIPDGETVLDMARRLSSDEEVFPKAIFDEKGQWIREDIGVILNGRFVNPYERSEVILKEGDEVVFLPILHGG
jgi:molybdopterin converting factor small subunit